MALRIQEFPLCCGARIVVGFPTNAYQHNWKNAPEPVHPAKLVASYRQNVSIFDRRYPDIDAFLRIYYNYTQGQIETIRRAWDGAKNKGVTIYGRILTEFENKCGYVRLLADAETALRNYEPPGPKSETCDSPEYRAACDEVKGFLTKAIKESKNSWGVLVAMVNVYQLQDFGHIFTELGWVIDSTTGNPTHGSWGSGRTVTLLHYELQPKPETDACKPKAKSLIQSA